MTEIHRGWSKRRLIAYLGKHHSGNLFKPSDIEFLPKGFFIVKDVDVWNLYYIPSRQELNPGFVGWSPTKEGILKFANPEDQQRLREEEIKYSTLLMDLSNMGADENEVLKIIEEANPGSDFVSKQRYLRT